MVQVTIEDAKPSRKKLQITVDPEKIKKKKDDIVREIRKTANIRGFRRGKVPKEIIIRTYKEEIENDLKKELMLEAYEFAAQDNKIEAVSDPIFTNVEFDEEKGLSFVATVDVKPRIELKEYKGIEITAKPIEITDKDINKVLGQLQDAFATLEEKQGGVLEKGNIAVIDIKTFTKETHYPIKDFGGENLHVEIGKKQLIEEIENTIEGMKAGETKSIEASFDNSYPLRALKGKDVIFEVTLKSIKQKKLPELNDEFAQKINKEFKTYDDLLKDVKERLKKNKEIEEKERQKDELLDKLLEQYDFELPDSIVNQETNQMIMEYVKNMYYMGVDVSTDNFKPQVLREKFEPEAKKRVKATFILLEIAKKEGIDVSSEEINEVIAQHANAQRKTFEELYKEYQANNVIPLIQMEILGDKALDFLYDNAKIVEVEEKNTQETNEKNEKEEKEK